MAKGRIISVPPLCKVIKDKQGTAFAVPSDGDLSSEIVMWWDRSAGDLLFIRQENSGADVADVVTVTLSQLYATIDALNRSVIE